MNFKKNISTGKNYHLKKTFVWSPIRNIKGHRSFQNHFSNSWWEEHIRASAETPFKKPAFNENIFRKNICIIMIELENQILKNLL